MLSLFLLMDSVKVTDFSSPCCYSHAILQLKFLIIAVTDFLLFNQSFFNYNQSLLTFLILQENCYNQCKKATNLRDNTITDSLQHSYRTIPPFNSLLGLFKTFLYVTLLQNCYRFMTKIDSFPENITEILHQFVDKITFSCFILLQNSYIKFI